MRAPIPSCSPCRAAESPWRTRSPAHSAERSTCGSCASLAPFQPELGMGAIAEGPAVVIGRSTLKLAGITRAQLLDVARREMNEIRRRVERFRAGRTPPDLRDRTVILVDDGIATGGTMRAALRAVRKHRPAHLIVAVPVAPPGTIAELCSEVDDVVCLREPDPLYAIGLWLACSTQVSAPPAMNRVGCAARGRASARRRRRPAPAARSSSPARRRSRGSSRAIGRGALARGGRGARGLPGRARRGAASWQALLANASDPGTGAQGAEHAADQRGLQPCRLAVGGLTPMQQGECQCDPATRSPGAAASDRVNRVDSRPAIVDVRREPGSPPTERSRRRDRLPRANR